MFLSKEPRHLPDSLTNSAIVINSDEQGSQIEESAAPLSQRLVGQRVMTVALAKEDGLRLQESLQNQDDPDTPTSQVYSSNASGVDERKAVSSGFATHVQAVQDVGFLEYFSPEKCQLGLPGLHRLRQEAGLDEFWFIDGAAGGGR